MMKMQKNQGESLKVGLENSFKVRWLLHKRYFDLGYGLSSYPKWVVAVLGVGSVVNKNYVLVFLGAFLFMVFCYVFGRLFIKYGWYEADIEVSNMFNLFVKEMRQKFG